MRSDLRLETYLRPLLSGQVVLSFDVDIRSPAVETKDFDARLGSGGHVLTTWNSGGAGWVRACDYDCDTVTVCIWGVTVLRGIVTWLHNASPTRPSHPSFLPTMANLTKEE